MSNQKILHVVEPFAAGVLTSVLQLANAQAEAGYPVIIAYGVRAETPDLNKIGKHLRVRLTPVPAFTRQLAPRKDVAALWQLVRLMREEKPAIVHLHSSKAGFLGRVAARLAGIPRNQVFYSPRGFSFLQEDLSPGKRKFYRLLETVGAWFGGTTVGCSSGESKLAPGRRVMTIYNAIDLSLVDTLVARVKRPVAKEAPPCVALLGRIGPARDPERVARVARSVRMLRPDVRFLWIGGGDPDSMTLLKDAGVQLTGWLPRQESLRLLAAQATVFLHASRWEGLPLAVLEAMALKLPVVATRVIGNEDAVVSEHTGLLVDPDDLAPALLNVLSLTSTEQRELGANGRQRVETLFSLPVMMAQYFKAYGLDA